MAGKKKSQQHRKKAPSGTSKKQVSLSSTWVDELSWKSCYSNHVQEGSILASAPVSATVSAPESVSATSSFDNSESFSIISWNILAESYLSKRSHAKLPKQYQSTVFNPFLRGHLLGKTLKKLTGLQDKTGIMCLQEVDLPDIDKQMKHLGYDGVATPTTKGGGGRVDACAIYWNAETWTLHKQKVIRFDDLATLGGCIEPQRSLQGLQQSFLRRNAAIVVVLEHKPTKQRITVGNAHLYWNPGYEYVKLCQAHYLTQMVNDFSDDSQPIIICGDFNSRPSSIVHAYLSKGKVNAKKAVPWYGHSPDDNYIDNANSNDDFLPTCRTTCNVIGDQVLEINATTDCSSNGVHSNNKNGDEGKGKWEQANGMKDMTLLLNEKLKLEETDSTQTEASPHIRYLLDFTLNRFTRWLRILGIDAAIETEEEELQRTKCANMILFDRSRKEKRTILTTSPKLLLRRDCPPGTYLINEKSTRDLEASLAQLLMLHGVVLEPTNFLTRCVVCNGNIVNIQDSEAKRQIFKANQAPEHLSEELKVYACDGCGQGYWWCDKPSSSASRVKNQAIKLFEVCLQGGVPIKDSNNLGLFDCVNVQEERRKGLKTEKGGAIEHMEVMDWLKNEELSHPLCFRSAYAMEIDANNSKVVGESLPFTNVTHDFVDTLDYIWFDREQFTQLDRLNVPVSFKKLNKGELPNGHLLPSNIWPSDHLAIGTRFRIPLVKTKEAELERQGLSQDRPSKPPDLSSTDSSVIDRDSGTCTGTNIILDSISTNQSSANKASTTALFCAPIDEGSAPPIPFSIVSDGSVAAASVTIPAPLPSTPHGNRCGCGCVPNILSMFEMAELRKKAREALATTELNSN